MGVISAAAGFAVLMIALFAWLRADMGRMEGRLIARIGGLEQGNIDLRERMARIVGMLDGLRDSIAGRDRRNAA